MTRIGPREPIDAADEMSLLAQLEPGRDGLGLTSDRHRATFLPAVWDTLPEPSACVRQLKLKAGLTADFGSPRLRFPRDRVEVLPPTEATSKEPRDG